MLEALAAVSLAGNILQTIGFLEKLVSKSSEIRQHGTTIGNDEIEATMTDLTCMAGKLKCSETISPVATTTITKENQVRKFFSRVHIKLMRKTEFPCPRF